MIRQLLPQPAAGKACLPGQILPFRFERQRQHFNEVQMRFYGGEVSAGRSVRSSDQRDSRSGRKKERGSERRSREGAISSESMEGLTPCALKARLASHALWSAGQSDATTR